MSKIKKSRKAIKRLGFKSRKTINMNYSSERICHIIDKYYEHIGKPQSIMTAAVEAAMIDLGFVSRQSGGFTYYNLATKEVKDAKFAASGGRRWFGDLRPNLTFDTILNR